MDPKLKTQLQDMLNHGAPRLWALEELVEASGDRCAIELLRWLHAHVGEMAVTAGLDLPVSAKSGGSK